MVALVSLAALVVLVARHRVRRAWGWWGASAVALLGTAVTLWAVPVLVGLQLALWVDALRLETWAWRRSTPPSAPARGGRWLHLVAMVGGAAAVSIGVRALVVEASRVASAGMEPTLSIGDHVLTDKLALRLRDPRPGDVLLFRSPCAPELSFIQRVVAIGGDTVEIRCNQLYRNGAPVPTQTVPGTCSYLDRDEDGAWTPIECVRRRETRETSSSDIVLDAGATQDAPDDHDFPGLARAATAEPFSCHGGPRRDMVGQIVETAAAETAAACSPRVHYVVPAGHVFVMGDNRGNSADSRSWGPVPIDHVLGLVDRIWWSHHDDGIRWDRIGAID